MIYVFIVALIAACTVLLAWVINSLYNNLQGDLYEIIYKIDLLLDLNKDKKK